MDPETHSFDLDEPGFRGVLRVTGADGDRRVQLSGVRPDGDASIVEKDIGVDRDDALAELARRCAGGDRAAAVELLAHVGVRDPEP